MISTKPLKVAVVTLDGLRAVENQELRRWVLYSLTCASFAYVVRKAIFS